MVVKLAGAPTKASADWSQYLIRAGVGWVSLVRLPCLYASVNCLYSFHPVWAAYKPFSQLPSSSAWLINGITLLCIIGSGPTSLKTGWPVYKLVARLQTGQVCNQFTTHIHVCKQVEHASQVRRDTRGHRVSFANSFLCSACKCDPFVVPSPQIVLPTKFLILAAKQSYSLEECRKTTGVGSSECVSYTTTARVCELYYYCSSAWLLLECVTTVYTG